MNNILSFNNIKIIDNKIDHLLYAAKYAKEGYILEFGVRNARTFNPLANFFHDRTVYGFDSFEGLPEKWIMSSSKTEPKGRFKVDNLPEIYQNGELIKGWFDNTLPIWIESHSENISFLHIDSDLYSSCKTILTLLNNKIVKDTVIVFDELCNWENKTRYKNWKDGEWKALHEWCNQYNRSAKPLCRTRKEEGSIIII